MNRITAAFFILALVGTLVLFGCVQQQAPAPSPTAVAPSIVASASPAPQYPNFAKVEITSKEFKPIRVTIARGGTVEWVNLDSAGHDVFFEEGPESPLLYSGQSWNATFDEAGEFAYYDSITNAIEGVVVIK